MKLEPSSRPDPDSGFYKGLVIGVTLSLLFFWGPILWLLKG